MPEYNGQDFIYKTIINETKQLILKHDTLIPIFLPGINQAFLVHLQVKQLIAIIYVDKSYE